MQRLRNILTTLTLFICISFGNQAAGLITYESLQVETNDGRSSGRSFTGIWLNYKNVDLYHKSVGKIPRISFEFGSDYEDDLYSIGFSERRTPIAFGNDVSTISNNTSLGNQFFLHTRNVKSQEFEKFFRRLNAADKAIVTSACAELSNRHRTREIVDLALDVNRNGEEFRRYWDDDRRVDAITNLAKECVSKAANMAHFSDGFLTEEELSTELRSSPDKSVNIRSVRTNNWLGNSDPFQSGSVIALVDVNVETHENGIQMIGNKGFLWDGQLDVSSGFTIWGNSPCCPGTIAGLLDGIDKKQYRLDAFNSLTNELRRTIDASSNESLLLTLHVLKKSRKLIAFSLKNSVSQNSNAATIEQYRAHWSKALFSVNPQETISYIENELAKRQLLSRAKLKRIQTKLKSKGYYRGSIDGLTGPSTRKAIFAFQADNDFYTDGYLSDFEEAVLLRNSSRYENEVVAKVNLSDDDTRISTKSPANAPSSVMASTSNSEDSVQAYLYDSLQKNMERLKSRYAADQAILLDLKQKLKTSQADVKLLERLIDQQPTINDLESEEIKTLNYKLESASKNYKRVAAQLQEQIIRNKELESQIKNSVSNVEKNADSLEELKKLLSNSKQQSEIYKADLDLQMAAVTRLEAALAQANNQISTLGATVASAKSENSALQDKLEIATISLSDQKSNWLSTKSDLEAEITKYVSSVDELSSRLDELDIENQRLNNELRSSVDELDKANAANTITKDALTEAQQTIAYLQNELSQIPALKEKVTSLEEALEKAGQAKLSKTWRELAEDDEDWSVWLSDMPIKQILFCDIISEYNKLLDEALASQNQIRTNLVLKERKLELDGLLPRGELEGWVARVHAVTQTDRGDAAVLLELPCSINVGSGITSLRGEESWAATIPYGDRMYRELVKVGKGDFVIFNASLLEIDEGELGQPEYKFASNLKADKKLPQAFQTDRETFIAIIKYLVEAKR